MARWPEVEGNSFLSFALDRQGRPDSKEYFYFDLFT
jgi:hypothetical protein